MVKLKGISILYFSFNNIDKNDTEDEDGARSVHANIEINRKWESYILGIYAWLSTDLFRI